MTQAADKGASKPTVDLARPQLPSLDEVTPERTAASWTGRKLDLIQDVKVPLVARLGGCSISVAELFAMKEGQVLALDKSLDGEIDLLLEGRLIARGELMVAGDNFGLKITEVLEPGSL